MLTAGQILEGKYRIERLLAQGGMGAVFVGEHTRIKRVVAIKVLLGGQADTENAKRFEREAEAAGRIGSDHIVEVLDFGTTPEGDRFMVMEFLHGETLKDRLKKRSPLAPAEVIPVLTQVLEGLSAAHDAGIIHRDLKPDNIFLMKEKAGRKDFVKIVDFGISKFNVLSSEGGQMTQTGAVMGTPFYMSPEQARSANEVDPRSDLYAIGVILYESITGARPFQATTLTELLFKIVFDEPPHPSTLVPNIDPSFAALVMKCMARDAADRFQNAKEMQAALEGWLSGRPAAPVAAPPVQELKMKTSIMEPGGPVVPLLSAAQAAQVSAAQQLAYQQHAARQQQAWAQAAHPPASSTHSQTGSHLQSTRSSPQHHPHVDSQSRPQQSVGGISSPSLDAQQMHAQQMMGQPQLTTLQTWNSPPAPPKSGGAGLVVGMVLGLVAIGGAGAFYFTRANADEPSATIQLPKAAGASTVEIAPQPSAAPLVAGSAATTAPVSPVGPGGGGVAARPTASATAPTATAEATATADATPSAAPVAGKPAPMGGTGRPAAPAGTVSDLGY